MSIPYSVSTPHGQYISVYSTQGAPHSGGAVFKHGGVFTGLRPIVAMAGSGVWSNIGLKSPIASQPAWTLKGYEAMDGGGVKRRRHHHRPSYLRNVIRRRCR